MATFKIVLDKRNKKKDGTYNLVVRVTNKNDVIYCNITSFTQSAYDQIFVKNTATDEKSIEFREKCNKYKAKCERIFNEVVPFDRKIFLQRLKEKDKVLPKTLLLRDLTTNYIQNKKDLAVKTKSHFKTTINVFESFKKNITIQDITADFLKSFTKMKIKDGCSLATINSYHRNVRTIINHYSNVDKIIPPAYQYPYGPAGYSISNYRPAKMVLSAEEIEKIENYNKFDNPDQEYALAIWKILYYLNGSNFVDLLKLKWSDFNSNFLSFIRTKTENTRKNNIQPVVVPLLPELSCLISQVGDKNSTYVLGNMDCSYSQQKLVNKSHKLRGEINKHLKDIGNELELSVPLTLRSARDCYATSLLRKGASTGQISKMLNHSNSIVTEHYLSGLNPDETFKINELLITKK